MKANKFQVLLIAIQSIFITVYYLLKTSYFAGKGLRHRVDEVTKQWSEHLFKCVKLSYKVINPHKTHFHPHQAYIIMSNHESLYDIPLIFVSMSGSIRMIAKKELFKIPLFGKTLKKAEFIFIDRQNTKQAMQDLENAKKKMEQGIVVWIAPEGTRSRDGKLGKFKKGAFMLALQTNSIIIPVGIRGSKNVLPAKTWDFHLNKTVEVHIGQPINSQDYNVETRDQLMERVRKEIENLVGLSEEKPLFQNSKNE